MDYERDGDVENASTGDIIKITLKVYGSLFSFLFVIYVVVRPLFPLCYNFCNSVKEYNTKLSCDHFGHVQWIWRIFRYSDNEIAQSCGLTSVVFLRFLRLGVKLSLVGIFNSVYLIPVNLYGCLDKNDQCSSLKDGVERIGLGHLSQGSLGLLATTFSAYIIFGSAIYFIYKEFTWFTTARHKFLTLPRVDNYSVYIGQIPKEYRSDAALLSYFQSILSPEDVLEAKVALDIFSLERKVSNRENVVQKLEVKCICFMFSLQFISGDVNLTLFLSFLFSI